MSARPTSRTRVVPFVAPSANSYHCVLAADKPLDFADHLVMLTRQLQVQEADHPQEIERTKEKGGKLPVDLVKLAEIAISPVLGKGLAEFEVAFTNP
jgi:hypothetical protein